MTEKKLVHEENRDGIIARVYDVGSGYINPFRVSFWDEDSGRNIFDTVYARPSLEDAIAFIARSFEPKQSSVRVG